MAQNERFDITETHDTIEINFSSTMKNVDRTCDELIKFCKSLFKNGIIKDQFFGLNLVIREGLTNAVKHGNGLDPEKPVRCFMQIDSSGKIYMEIEDQGDGFDWHKFKGKSFYDVLSDHGRGLVIMRLYCPDHEYNKKGNLLILKTSLF